METLARLRTANAAMRDRDQPLDDELNELSGADGPTPELPGGELQVETIVMRTGRPVLAIKQDEAQLTFDDADSAVWTARLTAARSHLVRATKAVGRIEVEGHSLAWLGTGWLVAPDTIVTNRHVAAEFGRRSGTSFVFRQGPGGSLMRASIDLLEEVDRADSLTFELRQILHIEDSDGPDLAFLRVDQIEGPSPVTPINLAETPQADDFVAVIGYPARDSRIPDVDLMDRIFGNVYNKKRLAPGQVIAPPGGHADPRLLDPRWKLGIGRALARLGGRRRAALRRQVPRSQLRGLERGRRATSRRRAEGAGSSPSSAGRERGCAAGGGPTARWRSVIGHPDLSRAVVDHRRGR